MTEALPDHDGQHPLTAGAAHAAMEALPFADLDAIDGGGLALVLAPHPDDESLGCGGLIAESCRRGRPPLVAVLTDGSMSHPNSRTHPPERLRTLREAETWEAAAALGLPDGRLRFLRRRDTQAPTHGPDFAAAVAEVAALLEEAAAAVLLAPWRHDPHCDHEAASLIAAAAARRTGVRHLAYPVWGWTLPPDRVLAGPPPAGVRLDVSAHMDRKRGAIRAHRSQYSDLITDDPAGFRLPPDLLAVFDRPYEVFLDA